MEGILMNSRYNINFTDQDNLKLVREVEKHPILYNPTLPAYTRRAETDNAWDEIGLKLNMTGPLCKEKWKNMRVVFMRSLRSKRTKPYYLADAMKFLLPYTHLQTSKSPEIRAISKATHPTTLGSTSNSNDITNSIQMEVKVEPVIEQCDIDIGQSPEHSTLDTDCFDTENGETQSLEGTRSDYDLFSPQNTEGNRTCLHTPNDPVQSFLDSLTPELKEMTFQQFKLFKRKVLTLIDDITTNY